jgi:hypothetical protein
MVPTSPRDSDNHPDMLDQFLQAVLLSEPSMVVTILRLRSVLFEPLRHVRGLDASLRHDTTALAAVQYDAKAQ